MHHSIHHFVNGAIAAEDQHQVRAVGYSYTRQLRGVSRRIRGQWNRGDTYAFQSINGTLENTHGRPPDLARGGVVNQNRLLIVGDFLSITPR